MHNIKAALLGICALALASCQQGESQSVLIENYGSNSKLQTSTPGLLRSIDPNELRLEVELNGTTQTYFGSDVEDGNWSFDVVLEADATHEIAVQWYANDLLLLEETGSFITESGNQIIRPELEYISAGENRFDADCDGYSNIEELRNDTDPSVVQGTLVNSCELLTEIQGTPLAPSMTRHHQNFSNSTQIDSVSSLAQHMNVRTMLPDSNAGAGPIMQLNIGENGRRNVIRIELIDHPAAGRSVRFFVLEGSSAQDSDPDIPICRERDPDLLGETAYNCTMPYNWQTNRWYELRFEEVSEGHWQGSVTDLETDIITVVGTVEIDATPGWFRPQFNLRYFDTTTFPECVDGVPTFRVQHRAPLVNNTVRWKSDYVSVTDCVRAGGGWKEGLRMVNGELLFSATLGRN